MACVSVIIPTYNKREAVTDAIDSILRQSYQDFELVISDDGSTDNTPLHLFQKLGAQAEAIEILSQTSPTAIKPFSNVFSFKDITVQYHYGVNRGLSAARNRALRAARGDYIAFLESEDLWETGHLETGIQFFDTNPTAKLCRMAERYVKDGKVRKNRTPCTSSGWIFDATLEVSPMSTSALMAHRSCFAACGTFDVNLPNCDEYDLWIRLASRYAIYYLPQSVVTRRSTRPDGSSRTWSFDRFRVYALEKAFQSGNLTPEQRFQVAEQIVRQCERLVDGFRRQKSDERSNFYVRKRRRFTQEVRKLRLSRPATEPEPVT